jgi:hypothetical protein
MRAAMAVYMLVSSCNRADYVDEAHQNKRSMFYCLLPSFNGEGDSLFERMFIELFVFKKKRIILFKRWIFGFQ